MLRILYLTALVACGSSSSAPWPVPSGWKTETIPFPLGFAPDVKHIGVEELRFPPHWSSSDSPDYWSYTFVWRTTDAAVLDAAALSDEMTRYFRGLLTAVNATKVPDPSVITVTANERFDLTARIVDAFGDGRVVELTGWAARTSCGTGALWTFVLAPRTTGLRAELDQLARAATCR